MATSYAGNSYSPPQQIGTNTYAPHNSGSMTAGSGTNNANIGGYNAYTQANNAANAAGQYGAYVGALGGLGAQNVGISNALSNINTGGMAPDGTIGGLTRQQAVGMSTLDATGYQNNVGLDQQTLAYLASTGQLQAHANDQTLQNLQQLLGTYNTEDQYNTANYNAQAGLASNQYNQDILSNTQAKSKEKSQQIASGGFGAGGYNQDMAAYDQQAGLLGQNLNLSQQQIDAQRNLTYNNTNQSRIRTQGSINDQNNTFAQQQLDNGNRVNQTNSDIAQNQLKALGALTQAAGTGHSYDLASQAKAQRAALQQAQQDNANGQAFLKGIQAANGYSG